METIQQLIEKGGATLGIELGSTRIKAVLIDDRHTPIASGDHVWENRLEDGIWTYSLDDIWTGIRDCYARLASDVKEKYGVFLTRVKAMGVSAMMHGYMVFDASDKLLVPFRTWRNSMTEEASEALTEMFSYNIPQRFSIAHLYQAILNQEEHVAQITFFTTLAGYIHWQLTGQKVLGIGDASGMFPVDTATGDYDAGMLAKFEACIADKQYSWKLTDILPKVLVAGEQAGCLTQEGAGLLDPGGKLQAGIPLCPPEGDAGTGMAATNSVAKRTGNVSAGTSVFSMFVLERNLSKVYPEIDLVTTPDGSLVGMVHANNCTSDLNAWVNLFKEFAESFGMTVDMDELYGTLYRKAMEGDADGGRLLSYGYLSGENIARVEQGRPLFVRTPESHFNLANFMRTHLFSSLGALKVGMDILLKEENVAIDTIYGHGGLFKTKGVGQKFLAAAVNAPVSVMETAGEGGPWGMALLAAYMAADTTDSLQTYLAEQVFKEARVMVEAPDPRDVEGFETFIKRYKKGIAIEKEAEQSLL